MSEYDPTWSIEYRLKPLKRWLEEVEGEAPAPDETPSYEGPEVRRPGSLPISASLSSEQLRRDREEQGVDLWDRVLQAAYVLGMAAGAREVLADELRLTIEETLVDALRSGIERRRADLERLEEEARASDA